MKSMLVIGPICSSYRHYNVNALLGVPLDRHLTFNDHVMQIYSLSHSSAATYSFVTDSRLGENCIASAFIYIFIEPQVN